MRAFATANGKKKGRNWANRRCQHSKTKCKMPVGRRFMGLNLALIYLFDNPGSFKRRPPFAGYVENFKRLRTEVEKARHPCQKCLILCRSVTPRCILGSRICQRLWSLEDRRACSEQALQPGHTVLARKGPAVAQRRCVLAHLRLHWCVSSGRIPRDAALVNSSQSFNLSTSAAPYVSPAPPCLVFQSLAVLLGGAETKSISGASLLFPTVCGGAERRISMLLYSHTVTA